MLFPVFLHLIVLLVTHSMHMISSVDAVLPATNNELRLIQAASDGYTDIVRRLSKVPGINVNHVNELNDTALILAATKGHTDVVQSLLTVPGINVNQVDSYGQTALIMAALNGHTDIVRLLLKVPGINANQVDQLNYTALIGDHGNTTASDGIQDSRSSNSSHPTWALLEEDVLTDIESRIDSVKFDQPIDLNELKSHEKKQSRWISKLFKVFDEAGENQEKMTKLEKLAKKLQPSFWKAWTKATKKESHRRLISKQLSKYSQDPRVQSRPHLACALQQLQYCIPIKEKSETVHNIAKRSLMDRWRSYRLNRPKPQQQPTQLPAGNQDVEEASEKNITMTNNESMDCAICCEELISGVFGKYYQCQDDLHQIHKKCHQRYVRVKGNDATCPHCRSPLMNYSIDSVLVTATQKLKLVAVYLFAIVIGLITALLIIAPVCLLTSVIVALICLLSWDLQCLKRLHTLACVPFDSSTDD